MLYVQDRMNHTLGVINNYYNDTHSMILESGVSTYKFTIPKKEEGTEFLIRGNYIVLTDDKGQGWKFTIMSTDETHGSLDVECEDLGLELLNKVRNSWASPGAAQPFKYYFDKAVRDTGWTLGINEISNLNRTLSWDGRDTALRRLLSICTQFDHVEIEFKVEFRNMAVVKQIVNVYKHRGADRSDTQLIYGDSVNDIRKTTEIRELATAIQGVGGVIQKDNPVEGAPEEHVDFASLAYEDGEYYSPAGDPFLYARVANQQFNIKDTYLEDFYDYDTQDAQELLNRTLTQLKERCQPKVNYEVDLAKVDASLSLGDTVPIIDHDYKPELLLSGRVLQLDKSYTDPSKNKAVFGNFLILYSNISDQLRALQEQMKAVKPQANYMWLRYAKDDQGNGMTSTPTADTRYFAMLVNKKTGVPSDNPKDYAGHWKLIQGNDGKDGIPGAKGEDGKTSYTHFAYANNVSGTEDFSLDDPTNRSYMGVYSDFTKADSTNPDDYVWSLTKGSDGKDGVQGLQGADGKDGIPGKPGADGKTSYTHIAYANSADGKKDFSESPDNHSYVGMYVDFIKEDSNDPAKYGWSLIKGEDGLDGPQGLPGPKGADGKTQYTHIAYANDANGGGFSQTPSNHSYIGMYVDFTENDSTDPKKYAWSLIKGANGANGTPGAKGADGKTPYFHSAWANSADGKTGFSTTDSVNKAYLGTYTDFAVAASTDPTKYAWSLIKGKDGTNGTPGKAGADGKTPYFHTAWADSKDGKINFSLTDATNRGYLGTYTDFVQADSSDPAKYTWTELVGTLVTGAPNLIRNSSEPDGSTAYWTVTSGTFGVDRKHSFWKNGRDTLFTLSTTGTTEVMAHTNYFSVVHDKEYTFQMEGFNNGQLKNGDIFIMYRKYSSTKEYDAFLNIKPNFVLSTSNAVQLTARFTMPAGAEEAYIRIDNNGSKTAGQVADLWFTNVKIAQENRPSPYQKAPEDVEESAAHQIGNPNLVYNAGLQGSYKGGLDGWFVNGTNLYYRTTVAASLYNGVNGMGWNQTYTNTTDIYYLIDSKHYPADMTQTYSASVALKIYSDSTVGNVSAVLSFYDAKGARLAGYKDMGPSGKGLVDNANPLRDKWQILKVENVVPPAGSVTVAIQYYAHHKVGVSSKIHALWSAPVVNTGSKVLPYKDYQGNGADISQVNDALIGVNTLINSVPKVNVQTTAPTSPKKGDQWWVTDANSKITALKVWSGSAWVNSVIQQSLLNVVSLNAVTVTGSTINGSKFTNNFDFKGADNVHFQGVTTIANGSVDITWKIPENNQTGETKLDASGLMSTIRNSGGTALHTARLQLGQLDLTDLLSGTGSTAKFLTGTLNAQDAYRNSIRSVQWLGGWGDWGSGNGLITITRNGRQVNITGYPHHNNTTTLGNVFQLPAWAKPANAAGVNISATCYNSGVGNPTACKLFINKDGLVSISNAQKGGYVVIGQSYVGIDM